MERCDYCGGRLDRPSPITCRATDHPEPTTAQRVALAVERDLRGRRGLRQEWEQIDEDMQDEIRDEWAAIVDRVLATSRGNMGV